jgi:site-specific recombinase XerD
MKYVRIAIEKMRYLDYSEHTVKIYAHYIKKFLESLNKRHDRINAKDFKAYFETYNFTSQPQQNQVINALRFFYRDVLKKKYAKVDFQRPRREKRLPQAIDSHFLLNQISRIQNLKHKAIISLAYSVGLRVSEVINLKIADIDSKRMIIFIRQAKGKKDRVVPLTETMLTLLRQYFKEYRPRVYLFNGQKSLKYSAASCNNIVKKYIGQQYHFHQLRHSTFTNLTEQNIDLRAIQKLAGHSSSKTTEIYTFISNQTLSNIPLPI